MGSKMREEVMKGTIDFLFLFSTFCIESWDGLLLFPRVELFYITLIEIIFSEAIMRSLRSNKEMVAALLTDYKSQDFDDSAETLPVALPLENKYENRYENNEIRR